MNQAEFSFWLTVVALAVDFVIRVVAIIIVPRNRRPSSALGWLLAIFFIPLFFVLVRRGVRDGLAALRRRFGKKDGGAEVTA